MQAIAQRLLQQREVATLQQLQQQRNSLQVEDNIAARKRAGKDLARFRGRQRNVGSQDDKRQ